MKTKFEEMMERLETMPKQWECPEHGAYGESPDKLRMEWECPTCEERLRDQKREFESDHHRHRWWRCKSGVPLRYRCAISSHLLGRNASTKVLAKAVTGYLDNLHDRINAGEGMVLLGPPGLGKTLALSAIVNETCRDYGRACYRAWPDVLADLKAGFSGDRHDERREAASRLRDVHLLALDELGVKAASEFDHAQLFELIDYRYRQRKPTLVAANTTLAALAQAVGVELTRFGGLPFEVAAADHAFDPLDVGLAPLLDEDVEQHATARPASRVARPHSGFESE